MKIKLIKGWNGNSAGTIIEPEIHDVANQLIKRGIAVQIASEPPKEGPVDKGGINEPPTAPKPDVKPVGHSIKKQAWVK